MSKQSFKENIDSCILWENAQRILRVTNLQSYGKKRDHSQGEPHSSAVNHKWPHYCYPATYIALYLPIDHMVREHMQR